jgi:hypothetical protein
MTKKDYIRVIRDLARARQSAGVTTADDMIGAFARAFVQTEQTDNPRFDPTRFYGLLRDVTGIDAKAGR